MAYTRYASNPAQMINIMIGSAFISASTHSLAEADIGKRNQEKQNRHTKKDHVLHRFGSDPAQLELHQNRHGSPILGVTKIRLPTWDRRTGTPVIPTRRCNPARAAKVRHIGVPVVELPAERNGLAGHVGVGCRDVPGLVRVS